MPLHTPQSIWAKYQQPMLEITSDGIGVSLGANSYLIKPSDLDTLVEFARMIAQYWLQANMRPMVKA